MHDLSSARRKTAEQSPPLRKNELYEITIDALTNEGSGVGRIDGFAVFVPYAAPGDRLTVRIVKVLTRYAFGRIEQVLSPSADRIEQDCPSFGRCGGCALRHIDYAAELAQKESQVRDAFIRIGGLHPEFEPILGSERTERYRNKAQYPFAASPDGQVTAGFFAQRSHRVIESADCSLQPACFGQVLAAVLEFANAYHLTAYDESSKRGLLRHLFLRQGETTGEIMVCFVLTRPALPYADELIDRLTDAFPQISGILINYNPADTNVILGPDWQTLYGKDTLTDILCGIRLEIAAPAFYQVNAAQAERLYQTAGEYAMLTGDETLVDLYCGTGSIGLSLAHSAGRVIGVEIVPEAVENAWRNASANGIENIEFLCADAGQAAAQLVRDGLHPDVVIVDPPRKGCDQQTIDSILAFQPSRIVMVSCNPATAARDCRLLSQGGYVLQKVRPVDMFPRTSHVECVVSLIKMDAS